MSAVLKPISASLDGEFLVLASAGDHYLTATEDGLANALYIGRLLARDGWDVKVSGQEDRNRNHIYSFRAYCP